MPSILHLELGAAKSAITRKAPAHRIDVHDPVAHAAWAQRLGVSDERLLDAVRLVGALERDVSRYLRRPLVASHAP